VKWEKYCQGHHTQLTIICDLRISPKPDLVFFCASLQWTVEKMVSNIILVAVPPFIRVEPVMPSGCVCVCVCEGRGGDRRGVWTQSLQGTNF